MSSGSSSKALAFSGIVWFVTLNLPSKRCYEKTEKNFPVLILFFLISFINTRGKPYHTS
jgi:hypothetical protein